VVPTPMQNDGLSEQIASKLFSPCPSVYERFPDVPGGLLLLETILKYYLIESTDIRLLYSRWRAHMHSSQAELPRPAPSC
jgi:hypothetical protein